MVMTLGIFGLLWRVSCAFLLILVLVELTWAQTKNGEALRCLRSVFASILFVFLFPLFSVIDTYTDLSPGFMLRPILEQWVWIGYAVLATALLRFWLALHRYARKAEKDDH
jgi:hypothetical protein